MISLIGLPGSGKSTVGRQLARRLGLMFVDSDAEIEKRFGCTIREYFEREGEENFRNVEQSIISELAATYAPRAPLFAVAVVISSGGGTVLREQNRLALRQNGQVVYLHSQPDDIFKRLRHDRNRPLLQVGDPMQRLRDLYAQRDPLYRETAHFVVETGRPSVASLVDLIALQLKLPTGR